VHIFTLAAAAPRPLRVLFVSSVSAVGAAAGPAPELVLTDPDAAYPTGYARAKFLAESLCDAGAAHLADSVAVAIARAGQVAGPVRRPGLWNPAEWFPSLMRSSASLGCLPDSVGAEFDAVDFVPVDVLADVLVDLAMTETDLGVGARDKEQEEKEEEQQHAMVYNLRNPHPVPWAALLPAVADGLAPGTTKPIEVVPSANWLARLQEAAAAMEKDGDDPEATARRLPALKLLGFFQNLWMTAGTAAAQGALPMAMERTLAASPALAALGPVEPAWMRKWVAEWLAVWS
jgi:nucleoside-diphosphate-sugar epimerase